MLGKKSQAEAQTGPEAKAGSEELSSLYTQYRPKRAQESPFILKTTLSSASRMTTASWMTRTFKVSEYVYVSPSPFYKHDQTEYPQLS